MEFAGRRVTRSLRGLVDPCHFGVGLQGLPNEILAMIVAELAPRDRAQLSRTSKTLHQHLVPGWSEYRDQLASACGEKLTGRIYAQWLGFEKSATVDVDEFTVPCAAAIANFCNSSGPAKNIRLEFSSHEPHTPPIGFHQVIATLTALPKQGLFHFGGPFVAKNLATFVPLKSSLRSLNLGRIGLGKNNGAGAKALSESLAQLKSLQSLDLGCNDLDRVNGACLKALMKSLAQLESLTSLDLSDNDLVRTSMYEMLPERIHLRM